MIKILLMVVVTILLSAFSSAQDKWTVKEVKVSFANFCYEDKNCLSDLENISDDNATCEELRVFMKNYQIYRKDGKDISEVCLCQAPFL